MRTQPSFKEAQTTVQFLQGPVKIKDGLFMGDELAARDLDFIKLNKVTRIINTVSKSVPNMYERVKVQYLSVHWTEKEDNIFDKKNNAVNAIYNFIEEAVEQGESCLVHSINGKSRACVVLVAYLIKKYSWSLNKCLQFISSKKQNLEIRSNFLVQLQELEARLSEQTKLSSSWNQVKNEDDLVLANTFCNSKKTSQVKESFPSKKTSKRVSWPQKIVVNKKAIMSNTMGRFKQIAQEKPMQGRLKSILRGDPGEQGEEEDFGQFQGARVKQDKFISTISGNIVHVTVNNFINTQKKPEPMRYNTRPFSSDTKDREKGKEKQRELKKMFNYESSLVNFRNPYQLKAGQRIGTSTKMPKKREEYKNPVIAAYERPQSANVAQRKKMKITVPQAFGMLPEREEMIITGFSSKKRYPSSSQKDDSYKWK